MQTRSWEYRDDDDTKSLNEWLLGILMPGLYRGFDAFEVRGDLQLRLLHTATKFTYKGDDYGIYITQEGGRVREDDIVPIGTLDTTANKRIDLVIATHTYQPATVGGENAVYSYLKGTESPTPVAPYDLVPPNAIVLGEIHLPAGCYALNLPNVKWVRAETPKFANVPVINSGTITMTDEINLFDSTTGLGSGKWRNWALCNGQNGTPDLRGRFVVGFNPADGDYDTIGKTGGAKQVALGILQNAPHFHEYKDIYWSEAGGTVSVPLGQGSGSTDFENQGFEIPRQTEESGEGQPHENRPPYYVLAYIKKIA